MTVIEKERWKYYYAVRRKNYIPDNAQQKKEKSY